MDDDEEIERILRTEFGLELPDVEDDAEDNGSPSRLDDPDAWVGW